MMRRIVALGVLLTLLLGGVGATATAQTDVQLEIDLPLPALPLGPGPLFPLDSYGPRANDNVVLRWDEQTLAAIRALRTGPTINARALAIVHTAMYDAWAAYDATAVGTRLGGSLRRPAAERTLAYKSMAISYAAYRALLNLFPARASDFTGLMTAMGYDPNDMTTDPASPAGVGNRAAAAVLAFRANDGSNQANGYADTSGYAPVNTPDQVNDPFHWQPLRHPDGNGGTVVQKYLTPHWQQVTPFALTSPNQFLPPGPTQRTLLQLDEEVTDTLLHSATLTDLQKVRAEYWADGPDSETPPGHWCLFAQTVSRARGHSLDQDIKLFFALGNAELDASIASWNAKRRWDYVRPITAVRERKRGQLVLAWAGPNKGTRLIRGETWHPYQAATFPTPPFPEYVSGHSTFSGAGTRVLQRFTGSDLFGARVTVRPGSSFIEPGRTPLLPQVLIWPTFSGAAAEAGVSRRLGGIHFPDADLHGRELGASVGQNAWQKAQTYFNGTASG
jgi:PAP2 superfamily